MESPKCAYCGCADEKYLVRCATTGYYCCNGKGDTSHSHIVHFLKRMQNTEIRLPDSNPWSQHEFKCYVCGSTDVFRLGFVFNTTTRRTFFCCRNPCQFDDALSNEVTPGTFQPLIDGGAIKPEVVAVPPEDAYKRVTLEEAAAVCQALRSVRQTGTARKEKPELPMCQGSYSNTKEYASIIKTYSKLENDASLKNSKNRIYDVSQITWNGQKGTIKADTTLFKAVTVGANLCFTKGRVTFKATVCRKQKPNITIHAKGTVDQSLRGLKMCVENSPSVFRREQDALRMFENYDSSAPGKGRKCMHEVLRDVFLGKVEGIDQRNALEQPMSVIQPSNDFPKLNRSQKAAADTALANHFTLIQGPPGTGKTTVIASIVHSMVQQRKSVLVLAHTNVAVDLLTARVIDTGIRPCRVFGQNIEGYNEELAPYSSKAGLEDGDQKGEIEKIKSAAVVLTTTGAIGGSRFNGMVFERVIIDEAGQCTDPHILMGAVKGCEQLILVGDHNQLGPYTETGAAKKGGYSTSLLKRLVYAGLQPKVLRRQYRMHPEISGFSSNMFYGGLIMNGVKESQRTYRSASIRWPNPEKPIMFWNNNSKEEMEGRSWSNTKEATAVAEIVAEFARYGVPSSSIGIITPYIGQMGYLENMLKKRLDPEYGEGLEIDTVDAFQGREKDFIIFSCVRSNENGDLGFLEDKERMNVALTRAKYGLVVIGCASVFEKNKVWGSFIKYCDERNAFVQGRIDRWTRSTFTPKYDENEEEEK